MAANGDKYYEINEEEQGARIQGELKRISRLSHLLDSLHHVLAKLLLLAISFLHFYRPFYFVGCQLGRFAPGGSVG